MWCKCEERRGKDAAEEWVCLCVRVWEGCWFVWYVMLHQARLPDHPVRDMDVHKLVSGSGQGLYTHYTHKSQGQWKQPMPGDTFFLLFFSRLLSLETGTTFPTPPFSPRFTPNSPWCQLVFSHIFHHILHTYFILYLSVLTFHSLFHVSYLPVHLTCTSKPVSLRPSEWNPGGFLLNAVPFIVRLTICLSYFLCSDVSGKNKPLSYLHSPKRDRFIARQ